MEVRVGVGVWGVRVWGGAWDSVAWGFGDSGYGLRVISDGPGRLSGPAPAPSPFRERPVLMAPHGVPPGVAPLVRRPHRGLVHLHAEPGAVGPQQ